MNGSLSRGNPYGADLPSIEAMTEGTELVSPKGSTWVVSRIERRGANSTVLMRKDGRGVNVARQPADLRGWAVKNKI